MRQLTSVMTVLSRKVTVNFGKVQNIHFTIFRTLLTLLESRLDANYITDLNQISTKPCSESNYFVSCENSYFVGTNLFLLNYIINAIEEYSNYRSTRERFSNE